MSDNRIDPIPGAAGVVVRISVTESAAVLVKLGLITWVCAGCGVALLGIDEDGSMTFVPGGGKRMAVLNGTVLLTTSLPTCGRPQPRIIKNNPITAISFFFKALFTA
jgi:hypothetical protein